MTARQSALKILYEIEKNGAYCDKALKKELAAANLTGADNAFATELVYGVMRHRTRLDYIIRQYSSQRLKKLSVWILNILRLGVYQIVLLDKIPDAAAVDECVKLAKRYGHPASAGFVNAVLRAVVREGDVSYPNGNAYYEIYYSHPMWLVALLIQQYGELTAKKIIKADNTLAHVTIRVNRLKTTPEALRESLEQSGVTVEPTVYKNLFKIQKFGDMARLPQFREGLFTVQDISAYKAGLAVQPEAGELVIDVCAAPGGKTTHLAELSGDKAEIFAFDVHPHKVELIEKNAKRLGVQSIRGRVWNGEQPCEDFIGKADRVLADVPCSGLGVLRKKPDIKWARGPEELAEIIRLQKQILASASRYVKDGGVLVYSTCTVNQDENTGVVQEFIRDNPFQILEETTILPGTDGGDGFYICKLRREANG